MAEPTVLSFETHPGRTLTAALFKDVKNAKELRALLAEGSLPEFAYINARVVLDPFILQLSGHRALAAEGSTRMATRNIHTELVYGVSATKHVAESLKRFGINDDTSAVLVARFDCKPEELEAVAKRIEGEQAALSELGTVVDLDLIDKYFKVSKQELQSRGRLDAVTFRVGAKDCM
ncbi:hypothetical protein CHLRE_01g030950v5 [Chlamydomonas reinhardtii]|uniref:EKC/KEOPS complex subunit CGI121 n=1 Tax=Chlamydomonas reinhardtii TaxID=3055 RepID=A8HQJ0_CHLRE|nr:uncharacterized protein CHLRE_01g030950v5 [Chlamydomonas reinhardtii]PNW88468.1 hypothetical protein CHLRE_01g030950v5 [Chlamydomonas reinhardtii]|eukprot:XP_001689588.1 predicted protein [Chlamydomonas reinhardtii]